MNSELEDKALAYVLGELSEAEERSLELEIDRSPELAAHVRELALAQETLFLSSPEEQAPTGITDAILGAEASAHPSKSQSTEDPTARPDTKIVSFWRSPVWAAAAVLAICAASFAFINLRDQQNLVEELMQEVAEMQTVPQSLENLSIVTFSPQTEDFADSQAVALWDSASETAYLVVGSLPELESDRAYQIWALDDSQPGPIPGDTFGSGEEVLTFDSFGSAPSEGRSLKFAVSIEPIGGSTSPTGPVVLVSGEV